MKRYDQVGPNLYFSNGFGGPVSVTKTLKTLFTFTEVKLTLAFSCFSGFKFIWNYQRPPVECHCHFTTWQESSPFISLCIVIVFVVFLLLVPGSFFAFFVVFYQYLTGCSWIF